MNNIKQIAKELRLVLAPLNRKFRVDGADNDAKLRMIDDLQNRVGYLMEEYCKFSGIDPKTIGAYIHANVNITPEQEWIVTVDVFFWALKTGKTGKQGFYEKQ